EKLVRGFDRGDVLCSGTQLAMRRQQAAQERQRQGFNRPAAADEHKDRRRFMWREREPKGRAVRRELGRLRIEGQRRSPPSLIQSFVAEQDLATVAKHGARGRAPSRALLAAHLEEIRKIVVELQRDRNFDRPQTMISNRNSLIGGSAPEKDRARDMR